MNLSSIRRSLFLSFLDKYSSMILGIATNLVLARILTPYDIGVFSIAASLVGLAGALRDFGIGSYLLQEKELTLARQKSALGIAVVITWTIGGLLALSSGLVAEFYGNPGVRDVILALSVNFFFIPFTMVVVMMLRREMKFGALYRIGIVTSFARCVTVICLAILGYGFMAMAWSSVAGIVATFLMTQIELPAAGRLLPSFKEWRHIVRFGALTTVGQLLGEVSQAAPNTLIGRFLGPTTVGFYSRAAGILSLFQTAIMEGLAPVAVSSVALRHREGGDVRKLMLQGLTHITAFGWPFFSFVAILTFPIIRILFGDQWDAAVPLARLFCVAAIFGILDSMTWSVLQGTGYVGRYAALQAVTVPTQIVVLVLVLVFGGTLVSIGWMSIFTAAAHVAASLAFMRSLVGVRYRHVAKAVAKSAGVTICSSIAPALVAVFMEIGPGHLWPPVLIGGFGAGIGFLAGVFLLKHPVSDEITDALRQVWRVGSLVPGRSGK